MKNIFLPILLLSGCISIPAIYPMAGSQTLAAFRSALARRTDINDIAANYYDLSNGEQHIARQELKAAKISIPGLDLNEPEVAKPAQPASIPSTKTPFATGSGPNVVLTEMQQKETVIKQLEEDSKKLNAKAVQAKQQEAQRNAEIAALEKENSDLKNTNAELTQKITTLKAQSIVPSSTQERETRVASLLTSANTNLKEQLAQLLKRKEELAKR